MHTLHALFATTADNRRFRVSPWLSWGHAIDRHTKTEFPRQDGKRSFRINGQPVKFLSVRAQNDPDWKSAPEAKLHKVTKATIEGVRFLKVEDDLYESEDGKYTIEMDYMESYCEDAHPVKIGKEMREWIANAPDQWCWEAREAVKGFRKGYACPGGEIHLRKEWCAYNREANEQGDWDPAPTSAFASLLNREHRYAR